MPVRVLSSGLRSEYERPPTRRDAGALGADPDLDGPVKQAWAMAVLALLFLIFVVGIAIFGHTR